MKTAILCCTLVGNAVHSHGQRYPTPMPSPESTAVVSSQIDPHAKRFGTAYLQHFPALHVVVAQHIFRLFMSFLLILIEATTLRIALSLTRPFATGTAGQHTICVIAYHTKQLYLPGISYQVVSYLYRKQKHQTPIHQPLRYCIEK